jgi:hypothetical protein
LSEGMRIILEKSNYIRAAAAVAASVLLTTALSPGMWAQTGTVSPAITLTQLADTTTSVPGGTGTFTTFSPDPSHPPNPAISFGNVAFFAAGTGGQQGIYFWPPGPPGRIADLTTAIPSGNGNFTAFSLDTTHPPGPCISGGNVVSMGSGGGGQQGIYFWPPGPPSRIADLNTPIPGGIGNFTAFALDPAHPPSPCVSGRNAVFMGFGAGGQQGVYAAVPPEPPFRIADLNTPIPSGNGNFTSFATGTQQSGDFGVVGGSIAVPPGPPAISGSNVVFIASGAGGQQGIYFTPPGPPTRVADSTTEIPGQPGSFFSSFGNVAASGTTVAFTGGSAPSALGIQPGVYLSDLPSSPIRIADNNTAVPGSSGNFVAFGIVAVDADRVVFEGFSTNSLGGLQKGLYLSAGATITKIIDLSDSPGKKSLADLHFGPGGFSGAQVVFTVNFSDSSQAIFMAQIGGKHCPLGQIFWKNHPTQWPASSLVLGGKTYSQAELLELLKTQPFFDASLILARKLIAAKLNAANGADPSPVNSAMADADTLLSGYEGKLPFRVRIVSPIGLSMTRDAIRLTEFNLGVLSPGCPWCPVHDDD